MTPPQVSFSVARGDLRIDHSLAPEQIGALRRRLSGAGALQPPAGGRTVGLTVAALRIGKGTRGQLVPVGPGRWCMQVTHIDLRIGFADQTVYVPRGYASGSCEYEAVLDHERLHVEDNLDVLHGFIQAFNDRAQVTALAMKPFPVSSPEEAKARSMAMVEAALEPLVGDFRDAQAGHAARRDSQEEYAAITARCTNW